MSDDVEFVYILTNPAMPDYVKVGITNDIERRIKDLSRPTAIAEPFECFGYLTVKGNKPSAHDIETILHFFLSREFRQTKEYFVASVPEVEKCFKYIEIINPRIKYSLYKSTTKEKSRQTTFEMLRIPVGAELAFKTDDSIRCKVVDNKNTVLYNGEHTSLSAIAMKQNNGKPVNGFERFVYPASDHPKETLWKRRQRLQSEL